MILTSIKIIQLNLMKIIRSPGWDRYKKIKYLNGKNKKLRNILIERKLMDILVPKNDEFFGEYNPDHNDRLKFYFKFFRFIWFRCDIKK